MAQVISTLTNAISYLNTLYEADSTAPASGDEDYTVWTALFNLAVNLWESEEGVLWKELFTKLSDNSTGGDTTTVTGDYSYTVPTAFRFPASGIVWLGTSTNKIPFTVIKQEDLVLYENNASSWCFFNLDSTPTLEFNPNCSIPDAQTISYNYYKKATALATGTDTFEMSDPMFAVYYALSELKKEEGDATAGTIATQKLEGMRTRNQLPAWYQSNSVTNLTESGFGV